MENKQAAPGIINPFRKAVKYEAKGRLAFIGPAGSGKTWTMLTALRALIGPTGRMAVIDTEHGSASKYADIFDFDVIELSSFTGDAFMSNLKAAAAAGYDAFGCDSLSHFWMGKDGALEFVDMAAKRHKDNMGGWKEFRPHERAMVDSILAAPLHVGITMRTKTEYVEEVNESTGKKQRRKIGLAPVQREGLDYEFDLVTYMDDDNTMLVEKTRCVAYTGKVISKPAAKDFEPFRDWLKGAKAPSYITREQAEELYYAARARQIPNADLLAKLAVDRLGALPIERLAEARAWIAAQPEPHTGTIATTTTTAKTYDDAHEALLRMGISLDEIAGYAETLPFAGDLDQVGAHLNHLVRTKNKDELKTAFAKYATAVRP